MNKAVVIIYVLIYLSMAIKTMHNTDDEVKHFSVNYGAKHRLYRILKTMPMPSIQLLKGHCIEFKYYADGIHYGLNPPG